MSEDQKWTRYYSDLDSLMSPNEYLLKVLLGNFNNKVDLLKGRSWRDAFQQRRILDMSCGDGRNIILFNQLRFDIYATEISTEICTKVHRNLAERDVEIPRNNIKVGYNADIPFESEFFDFLVSWNAIYYLRDTSEDICDALNEVNRVLAPGGYFICSVPGPKCYSVLGAEKLDEARVQLNPTVNSDWGGGLQKGTIYHLFRDKKNLENYLSPLFEDIQISELYWDGFGVPLHYFIFICKKKT